MVFSPWTNIIYIISFRNQTQFTKDDVHVIQSSVTASGNNTKLSVSVTQPGSTKPVSSTVVQDALQLSFQQNGKSEGSSLSLGLTNTPMPTTTETRNSIEVVLTNFNVNQVKCTWGEYKHYNNMFICLWKCPRWLLMFISQCPLYLYL